MLASRGRRLLGHLAPAATPAAATENPILRLPLAHPADIDGEQAFISVFQPTRAAACTSPVTGTAVVVCPGGGYRSLAMEGGVGSPTHGLPGEAIAQWLCEHGIVAVVLEYRLPRGRKEVPLTDAQLAITTVRARAVEWGIDEAKVGIIGFSAGGHLVLSAATLFTSPADRPDFVIAVYPVVTMEGDWRHQGSVDNLLGDSPTSEDMQHYSLEQQVTADTPPTFLAHALDDMAVPVENSRRFAAECWAHDVPTQLLELSDGGHGLNGYQGPNWEAWKGQAIRWLATVVSGVPLPV